MDKNQKSTNTQHKTGAAAHSDKDSAKHATSSKKMMGDSKSEKGMQASSDKSSKGK